MKAKAKKPGKKAMFLKVKPSVSAKKAKYTA